MSKTITITLPDNLYIEVGELAAANSISRSSYIASCVQQMGETNRQLQILKSDPALLADVVKAVAKSGLVK